MNELEEIIASQSVVIDRLRAEVSEHSTWAVVYKTAIEENNRLRAELAAIVKTADVAMNQAVSWEGNARQNYSRAERDEAAIARVRDLCRESLGSPSTTVRAWSRDVLRALDGAE